MPNAARLTRNVLLTALVSLSAGCATQPTQDSVPNASPTGTSDRATPRAKPGKGTPNKRPVVAKREFKATTVTGDYAGYPAVDQFIGRMVTQHGFDRDYLYGLFSEVERKEWTLNYLGRETPSTGGPPKPGSWSRYREKFLTERHIDDGADFWRLYSRDLERAQQRYGVPAEYIVGIIGVETLYGANVGTHRVIDALSTLAFDYPRRSDYFTEELEKYLLMARAEGIDPTSAVGSYAGAMGLGQFMPGSFVNWAVDFDGDGRKDLWNPVDAIGSVANYFAQHGWQSGGTVVTPALAQSARAKALETGFKTSYSLGTLASHDIRPAAQIRGDDDLRLLRLSTYSGDEWWLGHHNFYVITRYNHSTLYAMAVHQLAQAVKQRHARTGVVAQNARPSDAG
jgi:membrane-bound lytic murein transglycosylase B